MLSVAAGATQRVPGSDISESSVILDNRADTQIHTYIHTDTHTATRTHTHDSANNDEIHCKDDHNDKDADDGHGYSNVSIYDGSNIDSNNRNSSNDSFSIFTFTTNGNLAITPSAWL